MNPIDNQTLSDLIKKAFPEAVFEVRNYKHDDFHYSLKITTEDFRGKTKIEQHRMVKEVLKEYLLDGTLHALTIKTSVPQN